MALVNLLHEVERRVEIGELPRRVLRNRRFDFTPTMQTVVDRGDALYLPRRTVDGEDVPYRVAGLVPRSRASSGRGVVGATIICESAAVIVTADDPRRWNMRIDGGHAEGLSITGGTWGRRSRGVLRQTKVRGRPGSLNRACFDHMTVSDCTRGFEIGSANGVVWRNCAFVDVEQVGVYLGKSGALTIRRGNIHTCSIEQCSFERVGLAAHGGAAIAIDTENEGRRTRSKQCLRVLACSFRHVGVHAVWARGWLYGFALEGCLFERAAAGGVCDVALQAPGPIPIRSASIRANIFSTPCATQTARVLLSGRVWCRLSDNVSLVRMSGGRRLRFVEMDRPSDPRFRFMERNLEVDHGPLEPASGLGSPPAGPFRR